VKPLPSIPFFGKRKPKRQVPILKPLVKLEGLQTFEQASRAMSDKYDGFVARVGKARADEAMGILKQHTFGSMGSSTLPELLVEAVLKRKGSDYRSQVELEWARPDFVVFVSGGVIVIRVQGDYWHSREGNAAKDALQGDRLKNTTIFGLPVLKVADIWERDIYVNESCVEVALTL